MDRSSRAGPSRSVTTTRIRLFLSGSTTSTSWPANGPEYTRTRAPGTNCTDTASRHHGGTSTASCTCVMAGLLPRLLPLGASTWHDTEPHPFGRHRRWLPGRRANPRPIGGAMRTNGDGRPGRPLRRGCANACSIGRSPDRPLKVVIPAAVPEHPTFSPQPESIAVMRRRPACARHVAMRSALDRRRTVGPFS